MTFEKPLAIIRIEAADEARCDTQVRLDVVKPDWKIAQKAMNDAEAALLDAQTAARERFPEVAYDEETSCALSRLTLEFETTTNQYRKIDSMKRHLDDELKKLKDSELKMVSEMREPGIFDGGQDLGPNGWQRVRLRDLTGGPDTTQDLEKQVWTSMELETHGYDTIQQFLQGRGRLIPALVDNAEIAENTLEKIDRAVYRFLERRKLLDRWPSDIPAPKGEQMTILQVEPEKKGKNKPKAKTETQEQETTEQPEFDGVVDQPEPEAQIVESPSLARFRLPEPDHFYPGDKEQTAELSLWRVELMTPWETLAAYMGNEVEFTDKEQAEADLSIRTTPWEGLPQILSLIFDKIDLAQIGIPSEKLQLCIEGWLKLATERGGERGEMLDEYTEWFCQQIVAMGGDAVRRVAQWNSDLGAVIAAHQDMAFEPNPAVQIKANGKKKATKKKPATKKRAAKKTAKKTAPKS